MSNYDGWGIGPTCSRCGRPQYGSHNYGNFPVHNVGRHTSTSKHDYYDRNTVYSFGNVWSQTTCNCGSDWSAAAAAAAARDSDK